MSAAQDDQQDESARSAGQMMNVALSRLKHLDLSGYIKNISPVMEALGGYSDVYTGTLIVNDTAGREYNEMKVAIKRLRIQMLRNQSSGKRFVKEILIWSRLNHKNVLKLKGYVDENGFPALVSEWAEKGSVTSFLKNNPDTDKVPIVLGIAEGLSYLHAKGIVHSDMKGENILMNTSGQPMICDFGLSQMISYSESIMATSTTAAIRGTIRWMAYELLRIESEYQTVHHTQASDMWAFGMVIYEILAGKLPYAHLRIDYMIMAAICDKTLPVKPESLTSKEARLWDLCERCWDYVPDRRPSAEDSVITISILRDPQVKSWTKTYNSDDLSTDTVVESSMGNFWHHKCSLRTNLLFREAVRVMVFHPTEAYIISGNDDHTVKMWSLYKSKRYTEFDSGGVKIIEEPKFSLMGHSGPVTTLALSKVSRLLYSGSLDSTIRAWPLPPPFKREKSIPYNRWTKGELVGQARAPIIGLALVRWETRLVSCDESGTVSVWDMHATRGNKTLLRSWEYQGRDLKYPVKVACTCLEAIKTKVTLFAVGYKNSKIKIFDVDTAEEVLVLHSDINSIVYTQVNCIASHPSTHILVAAYENRNILLWDSLTGECLQCIPAHEAAVTSLAFNSTGATLMSAGRDYSVRFWDLAALICTQELMSHRPPSKHLEKFREMSHDRTMGKAQGVLAVGFHPKLPFAVSAGADGLLNVAFSLPQSCLHVSPEKFDPESQ